MHGFFKIEDFQSDQKLINEIACGNTIAFEKMYKKYVNIVYSYLLTRCNNKDDVIDILQETFISVWKCCSSYQSQSKFTTWIIGIARNKLNDYFRKVYRLGDAISLDKSLDLIDDNQFLNLESKMDIDKLLDVLPDSYKELVFMVFNLEMKYSEIAFILKIPEGTVKSRMARIRKQLKLIIQNQNGGDISGKLL